jgi:hypothetical protein
LDSVDDEYRDYMIQGRNAAQKEANNKAEQQNQKRNASAAGRGGNDDGTVGNSTICSVQFEDNEDNPNPSGGASSQFGTTGRKNRKLMSVNSSNLCIGKAIQVGKPSNYNLRARAEIDTRADTVCALSTFTLHESTGKVVDVSGFHAD